VIAMIPAAVRAYIRTGDNGEIWAICCAAGPALAAATAACGIANLLGLTSLSQLWPLLIATAATSAVTLTNLEIVAGPALRKALAPQGSWWPGLAVSGSAVPPALALIGVAVSLYRADQPPQPIDPSGLGAHWSREFSLQPGHSLTLTFAGPAQLRVDFDVKGHQVVVVPPGKKSTDSQSGKHLIVEPGSRICVDQCEGYIWPWKADWLPVLMTGEPGKVHVHGEFTAPSPGLTGGERLDLTKAASGVILDAGAPRLLEVPVGMRVQISVEPQAQSGDDPPLLAVFRRKPDNDFAELSPQLDLNSHLLEPGTYQVCVYFHSIEHSACNLNDPHRVIFETGRATLKISPAEAAK
jgi:hypothetical protein